jgi:hypothetical protein
MPKKPIPLQPVLSEETPRRKKPPSRIFLYAPFVLLVLLALGLSAFWLYSRARLAEEVAARAEALRSQGYVVDLPSPRVSGFPFRMKLVLGETRIASPGGWAIAAPALEGEAYMHALDHWVLAAPQGLTITRPKGGPLAIKGQALRASLAGLGNAPPRVVLQGMKLTFAPGEGARPFSLASAERLELYLRPDPESAGGGRFLIRLDGGRTAEGSTLGKIAPNAAAAGTFEGRLKAIANFKGRNWSEAVNTWRGAGGEADQLNLAFTAGSTGVESGGGALAVGRDGRLTGAMPLKLREPGKALGVLQSVPEADDTAPAAAAAVAQARAQGSTANLNLVFQAGVATLGPVKVGPSPKVN